MKAHLLLFACLAMSISTVATKLKMPTCDVADNCDAAKHGILRSSFKINPLTPGELSEVHWKDTGESVSPYAVRVGVPDEFRTSMLSFLESTGLLEKIWDLEYNNELKPSSFEFVNITRSGSTFSWHANRPSKDWNSNMHWLQPSNEAAYEDVLEVLAEGEFDVVLDSIGKHFNLDGIVIQGVGVIAVSHCTEGYVHYDMTDTDGKFFNVLVPLITLPNAEPELILVDGERKRGSLKYIDNVAVVVGDDVLHGTEAMDYRDQHQVRVTASIYIADVNTQNAKAISYDDTAFFPVPGDSDYLMANRGRHWGQGNSLTNDPGRRPFSFQDKLENCSELVRQGKCESDPYETRIQCLASCGVYKPNSSFKTSKASALIAPTETEPNYLVKMLQDAIASTAAKNEPNYLVKMLQDAITSTAAKNENDNDDGEEEISELDDYGFLQLEEYFGCNEITAQDRHRLSDSAWFLLRQTYENIVGEEHSSLLTPLERGKNGFIARVDVKNDIIKGRAIFAAEFIAKGTIVWYPRYSAVFRDGQAYRDYVKAVPRENTCDVLMFSYTTFDDEDEPIIVIDLDEGAYFNSAADEVEFLAMEGRNLEGISGLSGKPTEKTLIPLFLAEEEAVTVDPGEVEKYPSDVLSPFVSRVDIPKGVELTLDYTDFCDPRVWRHLGL